MLFKINIYKLIKVFLCIIIFRQEKPKVEKKKFTKHVIILVYNKILYILIIEAKVVFEVFDKKYAGTVDAFYLGDMLRCLGIAATNAACEKKGQTAKTGGKQLTIDEFLAIYNEFAALPAKTWGTAEDFAECLKLYDKDQNGKLILSELSTVLVNMGNNFCILIQVFFHVLLIINFFLAEKLTKDQMDELLAATGTKENEDGEIVYAGNLIIIFLIVNIIEFILKYFFFLFLEFVSKILAGPQA